MTGAHLCGQTVRYRSTNQANTAFHPFGVDRWVVCCNWMSVTSVRGGAIWWTLTKERQAWCNLHVKLCDPCLSALRLRMRNKWRYINTLRFLSFLKFVFGTGSARPPAETAKDATQKPNRMGKGSPHTLPLARCLPHLLISTFDVSPHHATPYFQLSLSSPSSLLDESLPNAGVICRDTRASPFIEQYKLLPAKCGVALKLGR